MLLSDGDVLIRLLREGSEMPVVVGWGRRWWSPAAVHASGTSASSSSSDSGISHPGEIEGTLMTKRW